MNSKKDKLKVEKYKNELELKLKILEDKLQQNEMALREAQKIAHIGNTEFNPATGECRWSEEMYRIFDMTPEEGVPGFELYYTKIHPDDREQLRIEVETSIKSKIPFEGDRRIITKSGKIKHIFAKTIPEFDETGEIKLFRGIVLDVTDRKNAELAMAQQFKMTALGEMAGGIAHEINTPLAIVHLSAAQLKEFILTDNFDKKKIADWADKIEVTTFRIAKIIKGLRSFARDGAFDPFELVSIKTIVDDTIALCGEKLKEYNVLLTIEIPDGSVLECRPIQISQILLNLLNNSLEAIQSLPQKWIKIQAAEKNNVMELSVTDSGEGIKAEFREKLMQPFFTTKDVGKGTGLGLSISKGIAEAHQGRMELDSSCKNTRFILKLSKYQIKKAAA